MFPKADQTAGPNGLNIFVDTYGSPGDDRKAKKIKFQVFFHGQRQTLQLV